MKPVCTRYAAAALLFMLLLFTCPPIGLAQRLHPEKWYQDRWCAINHGAVEVVLPDQTRCDCITVSHAVEFDFAEKWAEAIGQALFYALQTGKKAGIVLIIEGQKDRKYWIRLNSTIQHFDLPIKTWATEASTK